MGLFTLAWLIGEGIIVIRSVRANHAPPMPGTLIASSGIFALLALLAESDAARPVATALAYGFDLAAFMNLFPPVTGGGAPGPPGGGILPTPTGRIPPNPTQQVHP